MAKKNWRDRDRGTSKSRPGRRVHTPSTSRGYKADLDKLFDSGAVPERFKEVMVDVTSASGVSADRQKMIRQARGSETSAEFHSVIETFVKSYDFPDDAELLIRVLDLSDEAILRKALDRLIEMDGRRPLPKRSIIGMKLKVIKQVAVEPDTTNLADLLLERL